MVGCGEGGGGQNSSIILHEKCLSFVGSEKWPPNLPLFLQSRIIFFTTKRHSKKYYSSISDYFLSNLTTKRHSKKERKTWGEIKNLDLPIE